MVLLNPGTTQMKDFDAELNGDLERSREAKLKIE